MKKNADGSIGIYFAAVAREGQESNWLQTVRGKGWFGALRKGPVVVEVPKATDKANLFGQIADNW